MGTPSCATLPTASLMIVVVVAGCGQPREEASLDDGGTIDGVSETDASADVSTEGIASKRPKEVEFEFLPEVDAGGVGGMGGESDAGTGGTGNTGAGGTGGTTAPQPEAQTLRSFADLLTRWPQARLANVAGDARDDLVLRDPAGKILLHTRENSGFTAARQIGGNFQPAWQFVGAGRFDKRTPYSQLLLENPDGRFAIWVVNNGAYAGTSLSVMQTEPGWTFTEKADVNGDQVFDLVWRHSDDRTGIWIMNDGAMSSTHTLYDVPAEWSLIAAADIDGDQRQDLVWLNNPTGQAAVWLLDGGVAKAANTLAPSLGRRRLLAARDFDGDARVELALRDGGAGAIEFWSLNSTSFDRVTTVFSDLPADWRPLPPFDLDGDGVPELVWRRHNGDAAAWVVKGGRVKRQIFVRDKQQTVSPPNYGDCTCEAR
jgi:hypothetical protein